MNANVAALRSKALELSEADRAELAIDILDSLDDRPIETDMAEVDHVWAEETARRAAQIDSGQTKTDSWDDLIQQVAQARRAR